MTRNDAWWCVKWTVAALVALWVAVPAAVQTLMVLMAVDYATGLLAAIARRELCAREGLRGLARKIGTLLLIFAVHYAARTVHLPFEAGSTVATAFAVNELVSVVENCHRAGVRIPEVVIRALRVAKTERAKGMGAGGGR